LNRKPAWRIEIKALPPFDPIWKFAAMDQKAKAGKACAFPA
jgi:hypothetical protein